MLKLIVVSLMLAILVGCDGFAAYPWQPSIAAISPPMASAFAPELVARGGRLAAAGNCAGCHTIDGGPEFGGGYGIATKFGVIYSTNISPDAESGIGGWPEKAFFRALREGVSRDGRHLFPAFPYVHFTKLTDADVAALYAYFMTRAPVTSEAKKNTLPFPLNIRALQAGWKALYFRPGPLPTRADRGAVWNRGAYLAESLAHCNACHGPQNVLGAEIADKAYSGGVLDGRAVPALTVANEAPVPWSEAELYAYFRDASLYHGRAGGAMRAIVRIGLAALPDDDIAALAVYFADIGQTASRAAEIERAIVRAEAADRLDLARVADDDAQLYVAACASCHYNGPGRTDPDRPELSFVTSLNAADPTALISVILKGRGSEMPSFANGFSDTDISRIAGYLRATRTVAAPWNDLERQVAIVRAAAASSQGASAP